MAEKDGQTREHLERADTRLGETLRELEGALASSTGRSSLDALERDALGQLRAAALDLRRRLGNLRKFTGAGRG